MGLIKDVTARVGTQAGGPVIKNIPLGDICIKENVRSEYGGIEELAESIRQYGLQQPITVYRDGEDFIIKTGHRRYKAYELLYAKEPDRFNSIRCIVSDKKDVAIIQVIENVQREDLSEKDLYNALYALREQGLTHKQVAEIMGKSTQTIDNLYTGVNNIQLNEELLEHITTVNGSIRDIAETNGLPTPQRLELLKEKGEGKLSQKEFRQKIKALKEGTENTDADDEASNIVPVTKSTEPTVQITVLPNGLRLRLSCKDKEKTKLLESNIRRLCKNLEIEIVE